MFFTVKTALDRKLQTYYMCLKTVNWVKNEGVSFVSLKKNYSGIYCSKRAVRCTFHNAFNSIALKFNESILLYSDNPLFKENSSIGRIMVSKTIGCRFKSCFSCSEESRIRTYVRNSNRFTVCHF